MPILEMQSFSNFDRFLRPMSKYLCREWPFIVMFREIMLNRVSFVLTDQWAFHTLLKILGKNLPKNWSNCQPNQLLGNNGFIEIGQHYCPTKVAFCSTVGQVWDNCWV